MPLSHGDFDALQRTILELYAHRDMIEFRQAVPELYLQIIPGECFLLYDTTFIPESRSVKIVDYWESSPVNTDEFVAAGARHTANHPFTKYSMSDPSALMLSDFFTVRQLRDTEIYREFYGLAGVERLLAIASLSTATLSTLNMVRRATDKDFSERDRSIMNLLRPHFDQARRNAERTTARRAARPKPLEAYALTPRESEVARWLALGKTNAEIAVILEARPRTVEKHMENILGKLAVENRTAAALILADALSPA